MGNTSKKVVTLHAYFGHETNNAGHTLHLLA